MRGIFLSSLLKPTSSDVNRDRFMQLMAQQGVGTGLHFTAVHLHEHYRSRYGHALGDLPNTEWASDRVVSLPLFPRMSDADVTRVCEAIRTIKRGSRK